ncbi:MAG TPA: M56 family metallopeptidase [Bryobacteraceae bacterium]
MQAILNHLWQSTVFAGIAWLLTLTLKRNRAQTRYWLWFAASMKFLGPLALLVVAGSQVSWRVATPLSAPTAVEEVVRPFGAAAPLVAVRETAPVRTNLVPELLLLVWAAGFVAIGISWGREWTRMHANVRRATPLDLGLPVPVRSSTALLEPGVFGVFRPVLLLPEGITDRLTEAQLEAILSHELCHVRRRDNLATAMHMVVEAVFWFHPLVWWIGARLMEERERACDEEVLHAGNEAQTYAEGILKVCELYLQSPLGCVAGVSGANLNKRIEDIMTNRIVFKLNTVRKLLLAGAGVLAVVGPIAIGIVNAPPIRAQAQSKEAVTFEVASVKPVAPGGGNPRFGFEPGGRFVSTVPIQFLISVAYDLPFNPSERLTGGPEWIRSRDGVYEIQATGAFPAGLSKKAREDRQRLMLQTLLADRFKLKIHRVTREMAVYALTVEKGGPKLQKADIEEKDCPDPDATPAPAPNTFCHDLGGGRGRGLHARAVSMQDLAKGMENYTDRPLLDKTGIKGLHHIETSGWQPMQVAPFAPGQKQDGVDIADLPTIFTVFGKLGLKMESTKDKVDVYVIDHIEKPTEN